MINELYNLSEAIKKAGVSTTSWHRKYTPIPKNDSCIRISVLSGNVTEISSVNAALSKELRKYGTNQGSFPAMNLAPLYRVADEEAKRALSALHPEQLNAEKLDEIKSWCRENNWCRKFQKKYKISMKDTPDELQTLCPEYEPLRVLIEECRCFVEPEALHRELEAAAFHMLRDRADVALALRLLFYPGKPDKAAEDDYGSLSVAFDSPRLFDIGTPAVSQRFVRELNAALMVNAAADSCSGKEVPDAFGVPFLPVGEPMPKIKLAAGFDASLRTMFKGSPCQTRYRRIEDESYPISPAMRDKLGSALDWIGDERHKNLNWINTDKNEAMFVYPAKLPEVEISHVRMFRRPENDSATFEAQAKRFITEFLQGRKAENDSTANGIQIFLLRKIDKARTKVIYTRQTDAGELERRSEELTEGCRNLPNFSFGEVLTPFPLDMADILNRFWKQDGSLATDKFKPIPKYHGIELLMDADISTSADLALLTEKAMTLGPFLGNLSARRDLSNNVWKKVKDTLALLGLLLYRRDIRKEKYMDSLAYLYGQLLKISDELHALYCTVVRNGDFPTQLAGSGVYQAAAEAPVRTLSLLGQRMNPYITWAKSYSRKNISEKGKESWRAGWLCSMYEKTATKLAAVWQPETRFNDEEKALMFIGYLAKFPKESTAADNAEIENSSEEVNEDE